MSQVEGKALMSTLDEAAPTHPTACAGWTARDIVAHLAAGSQEIADLIEEKLAGALAGSDAVSDELLSQPELTDHAVGVLNAMPILNESSQRRLCHSGGTPLSIVLRAEGRQGSGGARWELVSEGSGLGDAVVHTDPADRLLVLWGRRSMKRPLIIEADDATAPIVSLVLWPSCVPWC